jgi:hypothetical protein
MANNYITDTLKDVLRHTHALGIYEMVKVTGTMETTEIETVDSDKTVILKGKLKNPVPDFVGNTVGLSRMATLARFIEYPGYSEDTATVEIITQKRNDEEVPAEVKFDCPDATANYRFMAAEIVNQQLKAINFKGASYDVEINPSAKMLKDLNFFSSALDLEDTFTPKTDGGDLYFHIGDAGSDRTKVKVAEAVTGDMTHDFQWRLGIVLKICRLAENANVTMSFNQKGLLQIVVDSGVGEYTYLLPASK